MGELTAEAVEWETYHVIVVTSNAFHQCSSQSLNPISSSFVPEEKSVISKEELSSKGHYCIIMPAYTNDPWFNGSQFSRLWNLLVNIIIAHQIQYCAGMSYYSTYSGSPVSIYAVISSSDSLPNLTMVCSQKVISFQSFPFHAIRHTPVSTSCSFPLNLSSIKMLLVPIRIQAMAITWSI